MHALPALGLEARLPPAPARPHRVDLWSNPVAGGWHPADLASGLGGSEEVLCLWAAALAERGHDVRVYHNPREPGRRCVFRGATFLPHAAFDPFAARDVLVTWKSPHPWRIGARAARRIHWSSDAEPPWPPAMLAALDAFVVLTPFHRRCLGWLDADRACIVPHGVDTAHLERHRRPREPGLALYCSSPDRGLETLLRDWPRLRERQPGLTLEVCYGWRLFEAATGGHPAARAFRRELEQLLAQPGIAVRGQVTRDELAAAYWRATWWVLPLNRAESELFCLNAVKAGHCGTTAVVRRIGALANTATTWIDYDAFVAGDLTPQRADPFPARSWAEVVARYWEPLFQEYTMRFVMYCPGMPFHGGTLDEGRSLGGSESAAFYLARALVRQGHQVTAFTRIPPEAAGVWEGVRYLAAGEPTQAAPLGADFEWYAAGTPHDVLLVQRVPDAFRRPFAGKVNLWWSHDLGLKRHQPALNAQLWNVDRVLAVSAFHGRQLGAVYGIPAGQIAVVPNGVDPALFAAVPDPDSPEGAAEGERKRAGGLLVYSSRPERGLEHLVGPGGIMERLLESAPELKLRVAGYDNTTPQLRPYYEALWRRCAELPNVEHVGALSKKELGDLMRAAWLQVYPTTFEEVSCITAMEAQAAGTPLVTSRLAALPETLQGGGAVLLDPRPDGLVERFERAVLALRAEPERWRRLRRRAFARRAAYDWDAWARRVAELAAAVLRARSASPERLGRHLIRSGDVVACRYLVAQARAAGETPPPVVVAELERHYGFLAAGTFREHYEAFARWQNARDIDQGLDDPARLFAMPRFRLVADLVAELPAGARVLDYACGQGHFTLALARRHPALTFRGVDLAAAAVAVGRQRLAADGPPNATLAAGDADTIIGPYDLVLACEVMEHLPDPGAVADRLERALAPGGRLCLTVPFGPWEAESFATVPFRTHIHHLERQDLVELWGHKPDFAIVAVPVRTTAASEVLGCYRITWRAGGEPAGRVDLSRKLVQQAPRETVSVCMLCRADGATLARTLDSVAPFADQVVLGIDGAAAAGGPAWEIARRHGAEAFALASPCETGFDAARNATLARARCDWVLWIDDDEVFEWPERLVKYLRPNGYDAYAVRQHHYAVEPVGLIKTDLPCRLFRTGRGHRFFGVVHEHPELGLNAGAGNVMLLPDVAICHNGYETEQIRRERFRRNLPLMVRDRQQYPQRTLGKFLWVRDLAHLNRYAREGGSYDVRELRRRAEDAVTLWRELLAVGQVRMALDALPYYSESVEILRPDGIAFEVGMAGRRAGLGELNGQPAPSHRGLFFDTSDIRLLTEAMMREKTAVFEERYF